MIASVWILKPFKTSIQIQKGKDEKAPLLNISLLVQIGEEI